MWILLVLPFLALAKDYSGEIDCDEPYFSQCQSPTIFREIPREMDVFMASCPSILSYIECVRDRDMKCFEEEKRRYKEPQKYEDVYALMDEICREGTPLNEVLNLKLQCLNETFSNTKCKKELNDFLRPYETEIQLDEFTTTHVIPERVHCLSQILLAYCIVDDITRNCGLRARHFFMEILETTEIVNSYCPLSYREGLLEALDEYNLTKEQKSFVISELKRMETNDETK